MKAIMINYNHLKEMLDNVPRTRQHGMIVYIYWSKVGVYLKGKLSLYRRDGKILRATIDDLQNCVPVLELCRFRKKRIVDNGFEREYSLEPLKKAPSRWMYINGYVWKERMII